MTTTLPKVTINLFNYNQEIYLRQAIESALNQDYENLELVLFDNGSTDGSLALMREYAHLPNVKIVFNEKNEQPTLATIQGIQAGTGEFISLLFADDYYLPGKIRKQVESFLQLDKTYGMVYSSGYRLNAISGEMWAQATFRESGWVLTKMFQEYAKQGMIIPIAALIRRECFERYPYRTEILTEGDDIFFRFALGYQFHFLPEPLVVMRDHANNMGKAIKINSQNFLTVMKSLEKNPEIKPEQVRELRRYVGRVFRNYSWQGFRVLQSKEWTWKFLKTSLAWDPKQIFHPRALAASFSLLLPQTVSAAFNRLLYRLKRSKEVAVFKESYA